MYIHDCMHSIYIMHAQITLCRAHSAKLDPSTNPCVAYFTHPAKRHADMSESPGVVTSTLFQADIAENQTYEIIR